MKKDIRLKNPNDSYHNDAPIIVHDGVSKNFARWLQAIKPRAPVAKAKSVMKSDGKKAGLETSSPKVKVPQVLKHIIF